MRREVTRALLMAALCAACVAVQAEGNSPRINYMLHCMGCHLEDGRGHPDSVPDMRHTVGKFTAFEEGREYIIRVPGVAQSSLPDDELAAVVNWMLNEFSPGELLEGFVPYTAEEVGELRKKKLTEVTEKREALLKRWDLQAASSR